MNLLTLNLHLVNNGSSIYFEHYVERVVLLEASCACLWWFVSATGTALLRHATTDNYPWIPEPITEYNVVIELLKKCRQSTRGRSNIIMLDLMVCMKALPLIWRNPNK